MCVWGRRVGSIGKNLKIVQLPSVDFPGIPSIENAFSRTFLSGTFLPGIFFPRTFSSRSFFRGIWELSTWFLVKFESYFLSFTIWIVNFSILKFLIFFVNSRKIHFFKIILLTKNSEPVSLLNVFETVNDFTLHNKVNAYSIADTLLDDKSLFFKLGQITCEIQLHVGSPSYTQGKLLDDNFSQIIGIYKKNIVTRQKS